MKKTSLLLFLLLILAGCVQSKIIDDIEIEAGAAFDQLRDNKFIGSVLVQDYLPDKSIENKVFTSEGHLRKDLIMNVQKQSPGELVTGGLVITIFGDRLANSGIIDFVDSYQRDTEMGARNYLTVSTGSALEILKGDYGPQGVSKYLQSLIQHNIKYRDLPDTNLHIFLRDYYMKGKDPYLPKLNFLSPKEVEISGISLFKKDREIDVLPKDRMFYFKLLTDKHSLGTVRVDLKKGEASAVKSIKSKHKYTISKNNRSHINIYIKVKGEVKEYTGEKLTKKVINRISNKLEKNIEKECLQLITQFQKQDIDPLGLGHLHLKSIRKYDFSNWEEDYKNLTFTIKADVIISETGLIR